MLLTPLTHRQILLGEVLWAGSKGLLGVVGVILVSSIFGLFSMKLFFILPVVFILSLIFAAFGLIVVSIARNYDSFVFSTSGFIIPLSLISGTYFSLKDMPQLIKWLAYIFPLSHAVEIVRQMTQNKFELVTLGLHSTVLLVYAIGLTYFADYLFRRKMMS